MNEIKNDFDGMLSYFDMKLTSTEAVEKATNDWLTLEKELNKLFMTGTRKIRYRKKLSTSTQDELKLSDEIYVQDAIKLSRKVSIQDVEFTDDDAEKLTLYILQGSKEDFEYKLWNITGNKEMAKRYTKHMFGSATKNITKEELSNSLKK